MMDKRTFFAAGAAAIAGVFGMMAFGGRATAQNVTLDALSGSDLASDPKTLVVDIRRPEEWMANGVIEGALLITYESADAFLKAVAPRLGGGQRLALICRSGNRTSRASQQIATLVDFPVVDVKGGMLRVLKEGYTPVGPTREMGCQIC